jgi:type III secretion protein N (ATPase)
MGMIARGASHPSSRSPTASEEPPWGVDLNVIALIGERGREVGDFLRENAQILDRCIVVASTSEESALSRVRCAELAFEVAEYYRDCGCHVLLQLDSLTRLLRAQRELGLAAGELPVRQGYPPSVFAALPRITERAGRWEHGSITALFTLLLSGDEEDPLEDPMVEEMRGLTDGHLILSHKLALAGQYPALDVITSLSRLASRVQSRECATAVEDLRHMIYRVKVEHELLMLSGRSDAEVQLLSQRTEEFRPIEESIKRVVAIHNKLNPRHAHTN